MLFSLLLQILQFALLVFARTLLWSSTNQTSIGPLQALGSRVIYLFPSLACTKLHSSKGIYAAMEIILEVTQALLLFVPQLTPTERTERTKRRKGEESSCSIAFGWTPGQLDSGVDKNRNITHTNTHTNTVLDFF